MVDPVVKVVNTLLMNDIITKYTKYFILDNLLNFALVYSNLYAYFNCKVKRQFKTEMCKI